MTQMLPAALVSCVALFVAAPSFANPAELNLEENVVAVTKAVEELDCIFHIENTNEIVRRTGIGLVYVVRAAWEIREQVGYEVLVPDLQPGHVHSFLNPAIGRLDFVRTDYCLSLEPSEDDLAILDALQQRGCVLSEGEVEAIFADMFAYRAIAYAPEHMDIFEVHEHLGMLALHGLLEVSGESLRVTSEVCI